MSILAFITGAAWGSFLNVASQRGKLKRSLGGRSSCDSCKKQLGVLELIPIFSYVFLRGKCKSCGTKIPLRNLIGEVFSALTCLLMYIYVFDLYTHDLEVTNLEFMSMFVIVLAFFALLYLAVYDIWWQEIPLAWSLVGVVFAIVYKILEIVLDKNYSFYWILYASIPLFLIYIINRVYPKQAFGLGDYFILIIMGLTLTPIELLVGLETAILSAALIGLIVSYFVGKIKDIKIALVPFLLFGWLIALNYTPQIIDFVLGA